MLEIVKAEILKNIDSENWETAHSLVLDAKDELKNEEAFLVNIAELFLENGLWEFSFNIFLLIENKGQLDWNPNYRKAMIYQLGISKAHEKLKCVSRYEIAKKALGVSQIELFENKRFLFVSGMPRSGTTAFGDLLNIVDDMKLFVELGNEFMPFSPNDFSNSVLPTLVQWSGQEKNTRILEVSDYKVIGDKRPYFFMNLPHFFENFKSLDFKVLHIVRNIFEVAYSYQMRANNSEDKLWGASKGVSQCMHEINLMLRYFTSSEFIPFRNKIRFVDYSRVLSNREYFLQLIHQENLGSFDSKGNELNDFFQSSLGRKEKSIPKDFKFIVDELIDHKALKEFEDLIGFSVH